MNEDAARLLLELKGAGISDDRVLTAMERTPRDLFVPAPFRDHAWDNTTLPIRQGQTISQPYVVAYMTEALQLTDRHKVLEVGTGSGYHACVLARMARRVYTVERYRSLAKEAEQRVAELGITNIVTRVGDGMQGWPEQAPFDRIIVAAAAPDIPLSLAEQLADGGVLIMPVGPDNDDQHLVRLRRQGRDFEHEKLLPVRFVPLLPHVAEG